MKQIKLAQHLMFALLAGASFLSFASPAVHAEVSDLHITVTSIEGTPTGSVGLVVLSPSNNPVRTFSGVIEGWTDKIEAEVRADHDYLTFKVRYAGYDGPTCSVAHNSKGQVDEQTNEILISIRLADYSCDIIDPAQEVNADFKIQTVPELGGQTLTMHFVELNEFHQQIKTVDQTFTELAFDKVMGLDYTLSVDLNNNQTVACTYEGSPALINDDWSAHYATVDLTRGTCVLSEQATLAPIDMTFHLGNLGIYTTVYIDMYDHNNVKIAGYSVSFSDGGCQGSCERSYDRTAQVAKTKVKFVDTSGPTYQSATCKNNVTGTDFLSGDQYAAIFTPRYAEGGVLTCLYETTKGW